MIVRIDKSFQKDLSRINDAKIKSAVIKIVEELQSAERFASVNNLKKLAGYKINIEFVQVTTG